VNLLVKFYKSFDKKIFKNVDTLNDLRILINKPELYDGIILDIYLLSYIYNINIILLDNRMRKTTDLLTIIPQESKFFILLYTYVENDKRFYDIIEKNGKYVFEKYDFSDRFRELLSTSS